MADKVSRRISNATRSFLDLELILVPSTNQLICGVPIEKNIPQIPFHN
jgi:hypothetical protein